MNGLQCCLYLLADAINSFQIRPKYLHPNISSHAGREHFDPIDDWLREDIAPPRDLQDSSHFVVHQISLGTCFTLPKENPFPKWLFKLLAQLLERNERGSFGISVGGVFSKLDLYSGIEKLFRL